ncbi:MAG: TfpX/TfpZ family type IV pilin accessory protein [Dokdonella sp.]|uniref:TfpX/TfpZ family type IV pilin accessory protein n=1 Tax=Dokdonella sp. TaxID=2291710 RepID=UPI0032662D69
MTRWKASAIHLAISLAIGLIVGALLLLVWYPPPYFHAAGADTLVVLMVSVDLVLGPLLTLIVFKSGKRGLKFDLALIGLLQAAALTYGLSVVLRSRPVFIAMSVDRLVLVAASDIDPKDLAQGTKPEFRSLSMTGPLLVGTQMPTTWQERNNVLFAGTAGKDIEQFPKYYVDYDVAAPALLKKAKPLDALKPANPQEQANLDAAIAKSGHAADSIVWVPLVARKASLVMLLDRESGAVLRPASVNPWNH